MSRLACSLKVPGVILLVITTVWMVANHANQEAPTETPGVDPRLLQQLTLAEQARAIEADKTHRTNDRQAILELQP